MVDEDSRRADELRCDLLVGLGTAQRNSGDARYRSTLLEAGQLARRLGDSASLVSATLANTRGFHSMSGTLDADRLELLDAALAAVGPADSAERARLLALKATELSWHPDHHQRKVLAEEALAIAERLQDPATIVGVLTTRFVAIHHPDTLGERFASCQRARSLAVEVDDPVLEFWASIELNVSAIQANDRSPRNAPSPAPCPWPSASTFRCCTG